MQNQPNICPQCKALIPADAPGGLCPSCILLGVAGRTNPSQAAAAAAPTMEEVAAAFPELEILDILGQGGMGIVFKARQPRLDRFVALKVLPPALAAHPGFAERFTREARVLARLSHPNIVAIYDFGESAGFFYLIMEFVNGVNLRAAMQAGVTPEQALLLVPRICEALQFAHDHGVLHRDIKPENILLDTSGTPKLADFGIAKLAGEESGKTGLTATGAALGTAAYMAPEQVEKPATVDHRADIYSLGVVLYEMLTGELPLGRFAAPSEKSTVNRGVDEVVMRALEKERERRQQSATDFKTQVEGASHPGIRPLAGGPTMRKQDALVTRILLALCALSAVGIPLTAMLDWDASTRKHMVVLMILFGTLAGLSKLFAPPTYIPQLSGPGYSAYPGRPKEKDLGIAYLLWFILGPSGLHKFYLGEIGWGLLYLFTGGLFLIGWIIDLFTLPAQVRRYNEKARLAPPATDRPAGAPPLPIAPLNPWPQRVFLLIVALIAVPVMLIGLAIAIPAISRTRNFSHHHSNLPAPVATVTAERAPFIGELAQGSLELVSVSPHPANGQRNWRMDGSPATEGPFVNHGSKSTPQHGDRAYDLVFRIRDLPAGASSPIWVLPGAHGWAGGGTPSLAAQPGTPVPNCMVISASFPEKLRSADVRMGVATQPWETLWENPPLNRTTASSSHEGEAWSVTQGSAVETKDGETVVSYGVPVHENWETRVVAKTTDGLEIPARSSSKFNDQSEWRFEHLPLGSVQQFRFQIRRYDWVEFRGVTLVPRDNPPPAHPAANVPPASLKIHYGKVDANAPGVYELILNSRTPTGWVTDFSCRIRDEKGEHELPEASFLVARNPSSKPGDEFAAQASWEFTTRNIEQGNFQLNAKAQPAEAGIASSSTSAATPFRWELHPERNEMSRFLSADAPSRIPFLRSVPDASAPTQPGAEIFIVVGLRQLKSREQTPGLEALLGSDRFEKLLPEDVRQNEAIQRAAQQVDETRARIKAGVATPVPLDAAERDLAIAEARRDEEKIAEALITYLQAESIAFKARIEVGFTTPEESAKAARELKTVREKIVGQINGPHEHPLGDHVMKALQAQLDALNSTLLELEKARPATGVPPANKPTSSPEILRLQDESIRSAHERLDETRKLFENGLATQLDLLAAERNLAVTEARDDELKVATALATYAEMRSNLVREQVKQGLATPLEGLNAEQELNAARLRLEKARSAATPAPAPDIEKPEPARP